MKTRSWRKTSWKSKKFYDVSTSFLARLDDRPRRKQDRDVLVRAFELGIDPKRMSRFTPQAAKFLFEDHGTGLPLGSIKTEQDVWIPRS